MDKIFGLEGKVAVVSASTKGIGLASAKALASQGAKVYLAVRNEKLADQVIAEIAEDGGQAAFTYFDASKPEPYASMITEPAEQEGHVDILVNNFGVTEVRYDKDILNGDTEKFFEIVSGDLRSVYVPCKTVLPFMIQNGGGSIINSSSIGSVVPDLSRIAYTTAKAAINSLTRNIAEQTGKYHIRCNAVLPGMIATKALMDNMSTEFIESFERHVPLGRVGTPEDIAKAVLYFASDLSTYVTGTLLEVAGGYALGTPQYAEYSGMTNG